MQDQAPASDDRQRALCRELEELKGAFDQLVQENQQLKEQVADSTAATVDESNTQVCGPHLPSVREARTMWHLFELLANIFGFAQGAD